MQNLVDSNWRLSVQLISKLNINIETVQQILTEDSGTRKISSKMLSWILTDKMKQYRHHISSNILNNAEMFDKGHCQLGNMVFAFNTNQKQNVWTCSGKLSPLKKERKKHSYLAWSSRYSFRSAESLTSIDKERPELWFDK